MNARGTDEEVFACVLTCGVSARTDGRRGEKTRGSRTGGGTGCAGREEEGERARRVSAWLCARTLARKHESGWFLARAEARRGSRSVRPASERRRKSTARRVKSTSARCTCHDAPAPATYTRLLEENPPPTRRRHRSPSSIDASCRPTAR